MTQLGQEAYSRDSLGITRSFRKPNKELMEIHVIIFY